MAAKTNQSKPSLVKQDAPGSTRITNGGIKIKQEPGARLDRLTSFRLPRDLTLGGINPGRVVKPSISKKVYTPNLNVVRNKNTDVKTSRDTTGIGRGRGRGDRGRGDRGGGRGRGRGSSLVQTTGLFSEGSGESHKRASTGWGRSGGSDEGTPSSMKRPTYVKRELKIDPNDERKEIQMILGEDDEDDEMDGSVLCTDSFTPVGLSEIKSEVKTEQKNLFGVKQETESLQKYPDNLNILFERQEPQLILIQLPDTLPGQTFVTTNSDREQTSQASSAGTSDGTIVEENTTSFCTMKKLDEGFVGKIVRYKSGKTKLVLGESRFDIELGIDPGLLQDAMSIGTNRTERSGNMINLGNIKAKISATPDWEYMFAKKS